MNRPFCFLVSTCLLLIFNSVVLIGCKKYGTNIIISDSGGCGGSWGSGGCGKGNIILSSKDKKGKGDNIVISGGGGGCCGWKPPHPHPPPPLHHHYHQPHHHHDHSWKPLILPIKVPSYHSHWPLTNWPHTSSWSHQPLDHHSHHGHHGHHHSSHSHHHDILLDKHDSLLSTDIWDGGKHYHGLLGDTRHELDHSPWNEWLGSSSVSPSWSKKNDFSSLGELASDSWNEI